jgi:DNA processing protein
LKDLVWRGKYTCPPVLYYKGNLRNAFQTESIAIIGTRRPTDEGLQAAVAIGEYYALEGFNIVSGLAAGCDGAAHRGALKGNGITTAIVATGLVLFIPARIRLWQSK